MNIANFLHSPSDRWRGLRGQKQFIVYMRYSAHALTVMWLVLFLKFDGADSTLLLLCTILTLWIVETSPGVNHRPRRSRMWALIMGGGLLCVVVTVGIVGFLLYDDGARRYAMLFISLWALICLAWAVVPQIKGRWLLALGLSGTVLGLCLWSDFGDDWVFAFLTFGMFLIMVLTEWTVGVIKELDQAKANEVALSANNERLRIAQQLHDSLGQSLAAMNLKVQVIDRLLAKENDPSTGVITEVNQLKTLINETSVHMREVVHDYRKVDLQGEFHNARELLEAMGIQVLENGKLSEVGELSGSAQQVAGWFIREVSTNIMRHAEADLVEVSWASGSIEITNDGAAAPVGRLSGLATLQQRARKSATITATQQGTQFTTRLIFGDNA